MLPSRAPLRTILPFFRLAPSLRLSAYQATVPRSFSTSAPKQNLLLDLAVAPPALLLDALHSTGLPWYAVLPLSATIVRGIFVHTFSAVPSRRAAQIRSHLVPLAAARLGHETPAVIKAAWVAKADAAITSIRLLHRLGKDFRAPLWHPRGFLNFGMLIAFTEAIRLKCGAREGLLPLLLTPFDWISKKLQLAYQWLAQNLELGQFPFTGADAEGITSTVQLPPRIGQTSTINENCFDPTMQSEGFRWCLDLTIPDPTLVLPVALSVAMAARSLLAPSPPLSPTNTTALARPSLLRGMTNMQRIGLSFSLVFFFVALKLPAGILLYFIPSIMVGWLQQRWLERSMPVYPPITACKRPVRVKVRKMRSDA